MYLQYLARQRGGYCLSNYYKGRDKKLQWQCAKGHRWQATARSVSHTGSWCPFCARNAPLSLEDMQGIAKSRGGQCLSQEYINSKTKMLWQCAKGHRWMATAFSIRVRKSWCPVCAGNQPIKRLLEIHQLQEFKNQRL